MAVIRIDNLNQKIYEIGFMPEPWVRIRASNSKFTNTIPDYMYDCVVHEASHPLNIDMDEYIRTVVCEAEEDPTLQSKVTFYVDHKRFSDDDICRIRHVCHRPEIEWAVENSFDGLYVAKFMNPRTITTVYRFVVYLEGSLASYWQLKYGDMSDRRIFI